MRWSKVMFAFATLQKRKKAAHFITRVAKGLVRVTRRLLRRLHWPQNDNMHARVHKRTWEWKGREAA